MKLYLLERSDADYDEYFTFLIRAISEERAREIAQKEDRNERTDAWLNKLRSTCEIITEDGEEEIIVSEFYDG